MLSITRFHGISPSSAKEKGARLRSFALLKIILTLEGGTMTEYRLGGNYDIEMYTAPTEDPAKTYSEIWIPVVKA